VVSKTTVATSHTQTANSWTDIKQRIIDRAINEWQKTTVGLCQGRITALRIPAVTSNTARQKHCLKHLIFLFIRQHQLWNDA